jgi:hypothetical protein
MQAAKTGSFTSVQAAQSEKIQLKPKDSLAKIK